MRTPKVLVVAKDNALQQSLADVVSDGCAVETRGDGRSAVALIDENFFDLLIIWDDLGTDVAKQLLIRWDRMSPGLAAILFRNGVSPRGTGSGLVIDLQGPIGKDPLQSKVRELLAQTAAARQQQFEIFQESSKPQELFIGSAPALQEVLAQAEETSRCDVPVLVLGESGTGKELLAQFIHQRSKRRRGPLKAVNSGGIPGTLIETTLFGHVKGSFTGADGDKPGVFELARNGTLFLDEIGEMPAEVQVRLLRAVETKRIAPVGSSKEIPVDVRLIAATHRDLMEGVACGQFRADLYYRLAVAVLRMPPLRERLDDIPSLADHLISKRRAMFESKGIEGASAEAIDKLQRHPWPGNVRELDNVLQRAMISAKGHFLMGEDIRFDTHAQPSQQSLVDAGSYEESKSQWEREYLLAVLRNCGGNIALAATKAGMSRRNFDRRMKHHQLKY